MVVYKPCLARMGLLSSHCPMQRNTGVLVGAGAVDDGGHGGVLGGWLSLLGWERNTGLGLVGLVDITIWTDGACRCVYLALPGVERGCLTKAESFVPDFIQ